MSATRRYRALTSGVLAAALAWTAADTSSAHPDQGLRDLDLVASANPSEASPAVTDDAFASLVSSRRSAKSEVAATGSATCDGCDAASTSLLVLYVKRGLAAHLDNTAAAWTQACTDCTATALSVQVVVLRGVRQIVPNNRALAVNAACTSCGTSSAAYQVVVSTRSGERLSRESLAELRAWVAEQATALQAAAQPPTPADPPKTSDAPTPPPTARLAPKGAHNQAAKKAQRRAQRVADSALAELENLVTDDLSAQTVSSDVELGR